MRKGFFKKSIATALALAMVATYAPAVNAQEYVSDIPGAVETTDDGTLVFRSDEGETQGATDFTDSFGATEITDLQKGASFKKLNVNGKISSIGYSQNKDGGVALIAEDNDKLYAYSGAKYDTIKKKFNITSMIRKKWSKVKSIGAYVGGVENKGNKYSIYVYAFDEKWSKEYEIKVDGKKVTCKLVSKNKIQYSNEKDYGMELNGYYYKNTKKVGKANTSIKVLRTADKKKYTSVTTNLKYKTNSDWAWLMSNYGRTAAGEQAMLLQHGYFKNEKDYNNVYYTTDGKNYKRFCNINNIGSYSMNLREDGLGCIVGQIGNKIGVYHFSDVEKFDKKIEFAIKNKKKSGYRRLFDETYLISTGTKNYICTADTEIENINKLSAVKFNVNQIAGIGSVYDYKAPATTYLVVLGSGKLLASKNMFKTSKVYNLPGKCENASIVSDGCQGGYTLISLVKYDSSWNPIYTTYYVPTSKIAE